MMTETQSKSWGIRSKVWLEVEGKPIIGEGRMEILQAIEQYGSILHASRATGVSYRRIRGAIKDMERTLGHCLVESFRGGEHGGGAKLTAKAVELMRRFKLLASGVQQEMNYRFEEVFK